MQEPSSAQQDSRSDKDAGAENASEKPVFSLEENLLLLRDSDTKTRSEAFDRLLPTSKEELKEAYKLFRQVKPAPGRELDCLERLEVVVPDPPIVCDRCLCTVISPGYEDLLENMLDTFHRYAQSPGVQVVVFAVDDSFKALAHRQDLIRVECHSRERLSPAVKGAVYSAARFIQARQFLCMEVDMLVVGGLDPLWNTLDMVNPSLMLGVRATSPRASFDELFLSLGSANSASDLSFLTGLTSFDCPYCFNGGVLAGGREAFELLDRKMRNLAPYSLMWMESRQQHWGDEFLMNLCIALLGTQAELKLRYNQLLHNTNRERWLQTDFESGRLVFHLDKQAPSKILHFAGQSRALLYQVKNEIDEYGVAPE